MTYTVKAVKTFHGHDGYGWEAKLYNPSNKAVAVVVEDGWGGELQFHWNDEGTTKVDCEGVDYQDKPHTYKDTPEEAEFRTFCLALPKRKNYDDELVHIDGDIYLGDLVNTKLAEKEVKKLIKKAAVFVDGKIYTWNCKISHADIRGIIAKNHPTGTILNDLPLDEAVSLYENLQGAN